MGSARRLEELCGSHAVYRWPCGGVSTNHKSLRHSFPKTPPIIGDGPAAQNQSLLNGGLLGLALLANEITTSQVNAAFLWPVEVYLAAPIFHPFADAAVIDIHWLKEVPLILGAGDPLDTPDRLLKDACGPPGSNRRWRPGYTVRRSG